MSALKMLEEMQDDNMGLPPYLKLYHNSEMSQGLKKVCKKLQKEILLSWCFQRVMWAEKRMSNKLEEIEKITEK